MAGKAQHRSARAAPCPEIIDAAVVQMLDLEAQGRQALRQHFLAALIGRGHRSAGDQFLSQFQRSGHRLPSPFRLGALYGLPAVAASTDTNLSCGNV